jgi:hypothetical protein
MAEAYADVRRRSDRVIASKVMEGRVAVLVSGSGTNLQALLDDPAIRPHLALVLSDRPNVKALDVPSRRASRPSSSSRTASLTGPTSTGRSWISSGLGGSTSW